MFYGIVKAMRGSKPRIVGKANDITLAKIIQHNIIVHYKFKTADVFMDDCDVTIRTFYNGIE